jgi:hypothetical protein
MVPHQTKEVDVLKRFVIERGITGIGEFSETEFCSAARASNTALAEMGPDVQWQHSYVASNKTFCVYLAESEQDIREHAEKSGMPVDTITEIHHVIDPLTGND